MSLRTEASIWREPRQEASSELFNRAMELSSSSDFARIPEISGFSMTKETIEARNSANRKMNTFLMTWTQGAPDYQGVSQGGYACAPFGGG